MSELERPSKSPKFWSKTLNGNKTLPRIESQDSIVNIKNPVGVRGTTMTTASPPDTPVVLERRVVLPSSGATAVIISINRPDKLNCFNSAVCQQLSQRFGALNKSVADSDNTGGSHDDDDDTVAAVIFTGEGTSFCAGADLADPPSPLDQSSDLPKDLINNPVHHMQRLGVPIIAALKGYVSPFLTCYPLTCFLFRFPPNKSSVRPNSCPQRNTSSLLFQSSLTYDTNSSPNITQKINKNRSSLEGSSLH